MSFDPVVREHQEWLGFLQPVGLVVSPTALKNAQARVARNVTREQEILIRHTRESVDGKRRLNRFTEFAKEFWGWEDADLVTPPDSLSTPLQEYGEILRPNIAVPGVKGESDWQILIQELPASVSLDQGGQNADERSWQASPQARFERLLRDTGVPIGLLAHPDAIRLVYAPRGETAGHITFPIQAMCETAGRPMVAALHLVLDAQRLFALPKDQRLPSILQASRRYQNEVSIQLAGQVLRALNELCRGFNEANRATAGTLLADTLKEAPTDVYGGLLTTLMRMVFLLYAEDRNLMASDEAYQRCYGLIGLHEKLREDAAAYPDTMDQRPGAWAQFLTLSRLVHDGGGHGQWRLPARRGRLFDPDSYPFLEGRPYRSKRERGEILTAPKVSDGVLYRVLEDLLYLDGERISYRALDVEQIGSVYEAMMGFEVRTATGPSIGFKPDHVVLNLAELLQQPPADRKKWLKEHAGWEPAEKAAQALKATDSTDEILTALNTRISPLYSDRDRGTLALAPGDIYLQPTEERRRSGSHYTPRSLTQPIVSTTLDPVLKQLGDNPTPEQILNLKVCDPAMGSGAFLVEACRYLGDALEKAWASHKAMPAIPTDQDPLLHARRIVAQRCLYGVDKNPFAVDLAKLSLWLATFAKDHPFTFVDHSLRHGDSLVGLRFNDIVDALGDNKAMFRPQAEKRLTAALEKRKQILDAAETTPYANLETHYKNAIFALGEVRDLGDALVSAFFSSERPAVRASRRKELLNAFDENRLDVVAEAILGLRHHAPPVVPFHWELEFPEVFSTGGFDSVLGNPPFLGGSKISSSLRPNYLSYVLGAFEGTSGNSDLVSFFFRRGFEQLRIGGTFGLIATNTIRQGDTRRAGLQAIVSRGGDIYHASRRTKWPGLAAVVVSIVHVFKGRFDGQRLLDSVPVPKITSFLFAKAGESDPGSLLANQNFAFKGSSPNGEGFILSEPNDTALFADLNFREVVKPYLTGDDLYNEPNQKALRSAICFREMTFSEASVWPEALKRLENTVRVQRSSSKDVKLRDFWWLYERYRPELYAQISGFTHVVVSSRVGQHLSFARVFSHQVFADALNVFALDQYASFAILQSRAHETWARFFGSSLEDRLRYTPTDCFETFPFPPDWQENEALERIGEEYYQFRADLMVRTDEGLTKTYNDFHDKWNQDPEVAKLRDLHAQMDRAVLDAYGWTDLQPIHDFILDYEEPEEERESGKKSKRKEPWRYRWTDEFRDEVLAQLLELNRERAEAERQAAALSAPTKPAKGTRKPRKKTDESTIEMFASEETE